MFPMHVLLSADYMTDLNCGQTPCGRHGCVRTRDGYDSHQPIEPNQPEIYAYYFWIHKHVNGVNWMRRIFLSIFHNFDLYLKTYIQLWRNLDLGYDANWKTNKWVVLKVNKYYSPFSNKYQHSVFYDVSRFSTLAIIQLFIYYLSVYPYLLILYNIHGLLFRGLYVTAIWLSPCTELIY